MPKVLIADDRQENRFLLTNLFKLFGTDSKIDIYEAENSTETIANIIREKPDLVLLDIKMETNEAGLNAVKEIRSNKDISNTTVWAITAKTFDTSGNDEDYKQICLKAGFNDYIIKPFDMIELLVKVSKCLNIDIPEKTKQKIGIK
jgi:CheY-like chemotaxis protein